MKDIIEILFVIDVSGSMYGQKIASVNAAITECLAELKALGHSEYFDIVVSIAAFDEKMRLYQLNEKIENIEAPNIQVKKKADGFYPVTSFRCLYRGLKYLFDNHKTDDGNQGKNTIIILLSDAKPIDEQEYEQDWEILKSCPNYKNALKYVVFTEEKQDKFNRNTVKFVDYKADNIIRTDFLTEEISKLQRTFFANFFNQEDNARYDRIFV